MKKILAIAIALIMVFAVCSCTSEPVDNAGDITPPPSKAPSVNPNFKVGMILNGNEKAQNGSIDAHIEGIEAAKAALGLSDEQVIYKYDVPESEECFTAAVDLAEQGCSIIFANAFGHESYLIRAAEQYPSIIFCHATGQNATKQEHLDNFFNYFTSAYESRYVSGIVAGMKLKELMDNGIVTNPYIGYVGAFPCAEVISGYTAFLLGIRSIVPEAHMDVQYTNNWFDFALEEEAARYLIDRGCVIIGNHTYSAGVTSTIQAAYDNGQAVFSVGYSMDIENIAPDAVLTSAQNVWSTYYIYAIDAALNGGEIEQDWCYGYEGGTVQLSPLSESCAEGTQQAVDVAIAKLISGELHVFDCTNFTVNGEHLTGYNQGWGLEGTELISDGYFHESEYRSAPIFDIIIDGVTEFNRGE